MDPPVSVTDYSWYHYATPYSIFHLEFHFYFIIDARGPQLISIAYLHLVDDYVLLDQPSTFYISFEVLML